MLQVYYSKVQLENTSKRERGQLLHKMAYTLLEEALIREGYKYGTIVIMPNGKPKFIEIGLPYFNISHSSEYVMCAISDGEVGVDIQLVKEDMKVEALANRFYSKEEYGSIMEYKESERASIFTKIWCMKESYLKYKGTGMSRELNTFSLHKELPQIIDKGVLQNVYFQGGKIEDYYYGVCCKGMEKIQFKRI